ncbi:unnamed protein product [Calicophoron daubneyi]|uniref:Tyrosine-protein kinase n=1 Tax=Calicophoron daubneyi TaxID=300641 RepID=A0AAV2SZI8_CALDB
MTQARGCLNGCELSIGVVYHVTGLTKIQSIPVSGTFSIQTHHTRELQHRQSLEHITRECIQWEEALAQWHAVFANPLPNPWPATPFSRPNTDQLTTSTASSVVRSSTGEAAVSDGWFGAKIPDIQDLWHDDRARPVNLCEVSLRLTFCDFELCFVTCLTEAHGRLVTLLCDAQSRAVSSPSPIVGLTPNILLATGWSTQMPQNDPHLVQSLALPDLLEHPPYNSVRRKATPDVSSVSAAAPVSDEDASHSEHLFQPVVGTHPTLPRVVSNPDNSLLAPSRQRSRLWHSFRNSISRFRTQFFRANPLRASVGAASPVVCGKPLMGKENSEEQKATVVIEHAFSPTGSTNAGSDMTLRATTSLHCGSSTASGLGLPPLHSPSLSGNDPTDCATLVPSKNGRNGNRDELPNMDDSTLKEHVDFTAEADINKEPWFHGVLPRPEVERVVPNRLLQNQGDFLVRQTSKRVAGRELGLNWNTLIEEQHATNDSSSGSGNRDRTLMCAPDGTVMRMVLSVFWHGHKHFILFGGTSVEKGWHLENGEFPTIRELVEHHMLTQTPVTAKSGACLITPITRPDWELDNKDVHLVQKIGQGNFGDVYRGFYNGLEVAVKTCRVDVNATDLRRKFLQGETTALNFCHPHIVRLIGIAVRSYPIMIVMEYVPGGSLLTYLRKHKNALPLNTLLVMASDAASGMAYLESKNCIHRDLAARNCLVTQSGRLKIADFGMSREEHIYELSDHHGQIPIKWTAPEALITGRYTTKCDVWSYGVLLWEIFTFGDVPYRSWSNPQTREMVGSGYRLPAPELMPSLIRKHMNDCWQTDPQRRPTFAELARSLFVSTGAEPYQWSPMIPRKLETPTSRNQTNQTDSVSSCTAHLSHKLSRFHMAVRDRRTREN